MALLTHHHIVDTRMLKCALCGNMVDPLKTETRCDEGIVVCAKCKSDEQNEDVLDEYKDDGFYPPHFSDNDEWRRDEEFERERREFEDDCQARRES